MNSITKKWLRGSLLTTLLVLLLAEGLFLFQSYNLYYGGVRQAVNSRFANRRGTSSGLHRKKAFTPWTRTVVRFPLQDQTHGWERSMPRTFAAPTGGMYG